MKKKKRINRRTPVPQRGYLGFPIKHGQKKATKIKTLHRKTNAKTRKSI